MSTSQLLMSKKRKRFSQVTVEKSCELSTHCFCCKIHIPENKFSLPHFHHHRHHLSNQVEECEEGFSKFPSLYTLCVCFIIKSLSKGWYDFSSMDCLFLQHLFQSHLHLDRQEVKSFQPTTQKRTFLQTPNCSCFLNHSSISISPHILSQFASHSDFLRTLSLDNSKVTNLSLYKISLLPHLRCLSLSHCDSFDDSGLLSLSSLSSTLTSLDLSYCSYQKLFSVSSTRLIPLEEQTSQNLNSEELSYSSSEQTGSSTGKGLPLLLRQLTSLSVLSLAGLSRPSLVDKHPLDSSIHPKNPSSSPLFISPSSFYSSSRESKYSSSGFVDENSNSFIKKSITSITTKEGSLISAIRILSITYITSLSDCLRALSTSSSLVSLDLTNTKISDSDLRCLLSSFSKPLSCPECGLDVEKIPTLSLNIHSLPSKPCQKGSAFTIITSRGTNFSSKTSISTQVSPTVKTFNVNSCPRLKILILSSTNVTNDILPIFLHLPSISLVEVQNSKVSLGSTMESSKTGNKKSHEEESSNSFKVKISDFGVKCDHQFVSIKYFPLKSKILIKRSYRSLISLPPLESLSLQQCITKEGVEMVKRYILSSNLDHFPYKETQI